MKTTRSLQILILGCYLVLAVATVEGAETGNPVFTELTTRGVGLGQGAAVTLAAPTLPDGLSPDQQRQAIAQVIEGRYSLDSFLRKAVVAPFVLKMSAVDPRANAPEQLWRLDLWFAAYADLDKLSDDQFLKRGFDSEAGSAAANAPRLVALTDADLAARGIMPSPSERFFAGSMVLFDRVRVNAALQAWLTRTSESTLVAMRLDPRFDSDSQHPNDWEQLSRSDAKALPAGSHRPYRGAGGYLKTTRLREPAGALFVEYHLVFAEPQAWFDGANFLRSKLPLVCQDGVRKCRRQLASP